MKIKIKHNIKRDGCTLSGQILDCQFLDGAERGDEVPYYGKNKKRHLTSCGHPQISDDIIFVWGRNKYRDLDVIYYTYPTEQAAQDMLDFINTFVEKDEIVKEEPKEKRYMLVEVANPKCPFMTDEIENFCILKDEDDNDGCCSFGKCQYGKTLDEMIKEIHRAICNPCCASANDACNKCVVQLGSIEEGITALLGGESK